MSELGRLWEGLRPPAAGAGLTGIRAPGVPGTPVYLGLDVDGHRHLLISSVGENRLPRESTRAIEVRTDRLRVGDRTDELYVDIMCKDRGFHATFEIVAAEVLSEVVTTPTTPEAAVRRVLDRWRAFWRVDPSALSTEAALGLFGELWFMLRWLGATASHLVAVDRWTGPDGSRHDFQWTDASIEVKATSSRSGPTVHLIGRLDQLEPPETGDLFLFSLRVADDAIASNTLAGLVAQIHSRLASNVAAQARFNDKLASVGYSPAASERHARPLRIVSEILYRVDNAFPALTSRTFPEGLPAGVSDISYRLDMAACAAWQVAASPADAFLRSARWR